MARILNSQWKRFDELLRDGMAVAHAAQKCGIGKDTAYKHVARKKAAGLESDVAVENIYVAEDEDLPDPIPKHLLTGDPLTALSDITLFAQRYFGFVLMPWHVHATQRIQELYESESDKYVVINCPPGVGKSSFFTEVLPAFMTARDRTIKGFIGSIGQENAKMYTSNLADHFERTIPVSRRQRDIDRGYATFAASTLSRDYGRFKPDAGEDMWRQDRFNVLQTNGAPRSVKEPTWAALGYKSKFIGHRADFIIWDDLYDASTFATVESRDKLKNWYLNTAETRLDEGGLFILQGQRLSPDDIYNFALSLPDIDEDDEEPDDFFITLADRADLDTISRDFIDAATDRPRYKYEHIKFKAHYEDRCESDHSMDAKPYPYGCLLYPARVTWKRINQARSADERNFNIVYQQEDIDPEEALVNPIWITGGTDKSGIEFPGCYDDTFSVGQPPTGLTEPLISVCTVDPSASNYWAVQWWLYHPETEHRYLIDMFRGKLDASEFLDYNPVTRTYSGIMEEWQTRAKAANHPITYWIFEHNAAQRWFFRFAAHQIWVQKSGSNVITHQTTANKNDPDFGVRTAIPNAYKRSLVRLPAKVPSDLIMSKQLVYELTRYPDAATDDTVMANWFLEWNLRNIYTPKLHFQRTRRPRFQLVAARR